ncbi:MAG: nitrogenase cofactor biosynthesis protein NifB [Colwellia sp.]
MTVGIIQNDRLDSSQLNTEQVKTDHLQKNLQRLNNKLVKTHPCYSKDAHKYARIHLPVAPACNIQCNYCNRKFDCSNESRPGVVSKLLSPAEAIHRFKTVKSRMPELKVVGIAGPGDPLANPNAALATLKGIKAIDKDVHLCISTNGLNLPSHVKTLAKIGVHHLTITINTLDPVIAANLYPWIYFNNQRYTGLEAAKILIEQQLKGLSLAAESGILVKVNTVLVPGINDKGLQALALEIQDRGALLHNIMPLISAPEHGTFFGLNNVLGPTENQIEAARITAGSDMPQMSHCRQCRADAVGTLDADESTEGGCQSANVAKVVSQPQVASLPIAASHSLSQLPTKLPVIPTAKLARQAVDVLARIAVASSNKTLIDTHFGHAQAFHIYDISHDSVTFIETRTIAQYCHGHDSCNDDTPSEQEIIAKENGLDGHIKCLHDCQQVLCSRIGIGPWQQLEENNIMPLVAYAMLDVIESLNTLRTELAKAYLTESANLKTLQEVG